MLPETKMAIILGGATIAIILAGCNVSESEIKRMATADTAAFCDIARPIYYSAKKDTLATIQQVKLHNATGKICGWSGK